MTIRNGRKLDIKTQRCHTDTVDTIQWCRTEARVLESRPFVCRVARTALKNIPSRIRKLAAVASVAERKTPGPKNLLKTINTIRIE
ncbi:hypothetical protein VTL71DRAFT_3240, partial [Oculimacula yallundae]